MNHESLSVALPLSLCPSQQSAFDSVLSGLAAGPVVGLQGGGRGVTTVLQEVLRAQGGAFLEAGDLLARLRGGHPLSLEETLDDLLAEALLREDLVLFDDLALLVRVAGGCGPYPRSGLLEAPLLRAAATARRTGKRLIFGGYRDLTGSLNERSLVWSIPDFTAADYAHLCRAFLGDERAGALDFAKVHRFAPHLNAHHLRAACEWLRPCSGPDTERFIGYLGSQRLTSNVELKEVQPVDLRSLKGAEEVIEGLEAQIILPLEDDRLACELGLRPKRGVLLSGPPGTGKTTVGRALAHRLKSKFFLIDGKFIAGTGGFYGRVQRVFEEARQNAPSVLFIDDCDVIFQAGDNGFYRYLLTILDGVESETAKDVCVILTAMEVRSLPPALLRSGRVELWLEMRLPDEAARLEILRERLASLPDALGDPGAAGLARGSEGFTGADLKRLVEDGKLLLAYDRARGRPARLTAEYFRRALEAMVETRGRYQHA